MPGLAAPDPALITIVEPISSSEVGMIEFVRKSLLGSAALDIVIISEAVDCGCHQMVAGEILRPRLKKCHIVSSTPARRPSIYNFSLGVTCMVRTLHQLLI